MENGNIFFISHRSKDNVHALELYNLLLEINPEWNGKIFLDCCEKKPLESHDEWRSRMLKEVANSRHLIFVTSSVDYVKEGHGWLYEEISHFHNLKIERIELNRNEYNVSYFGIFLCECDFENTLFNDSLRGNEYRQMLQRPEHLILGAEASIASAKERIKEKVLSTISGDDFDDTAALILDKTREYATKKSLSDFMFNRDAIDDALIPSIYTNERILSFLQFSELTQNSSVALLGSEGGCGKTTLLTKLFLDYLDRANVQDPRSMIPLYVDAKSLFGENHLILRYLAKALFDEHTATTNISTSANVGLLDYEFSKKNEVPRYLLIIDGYNEIPERSIHLFDRELNAFLQGGRYSNVRVVISGRHLGNHLPEGSVEHVTIFHLENNAISAYLKNKGLLHNTLKNSLLRILSIPMYLKLYAETSSNEKIKTKTDLLRAFIAWQEEKDASSEAIDRKKALYSLILKHVLPIIAYKMLLENSKRSAFLLTREELENIVSEAYSLIRDTSYKRYYGSEYRELLRISELDQYDELDLSDFVFEYLVKKCKLLRQNNDSLDFIHQIYRDFFCAGYISEFIKRYPEDAKKCDYLSKKLMDRDIIEFVAELLCEEGPSFNSANDVWDYSCNNNSKLLPLLDINRGMSDPESTTVIANIVSMLRYARHDDLSGLDFSDLDLTKSVLSGAMFFKYDKSKQYSTTFAGSVINRENLFSENHFDEILAGCTNDKLAACIDSDGVIKLWDKTSSSSFPVKVITDLRYSVLKLLFGNDNRNLLAMTAHEIIDIPIPCEFSSKAEPKIIFKTAKRLRDIKIDENGSILFTTNLNSFNYKSINAPDAPDSSKFYGINSAAAVNKAKDRLAFGYIAGYESLMIYDYIPDAEVWRERKFGYSAILDSFFAEIEEFFKKIKLYYLFPTNNVLYDERKSFFAYMQHQFEDCTHDHNRIPTLVADRCTALIFKEKNITLRPYQAEELNRIVAKYETILKENLLNNNLLMLLSGRKITGLSFKKDSNILLVSSVINYKEKLEYAKDTRKLYKNKACDNLILELNTDTFETRLITRSISEYPLQASYCGDDIIVLSKYHFAVYDENGNDTVHITANPKSIYNFISPPNKDSFYAISPHFIYEFNKELRCIKSMYNVFNTVNLSYNIDAHGKDYLAVKKTLISDSNETKVKVFDLDTGRFYFIDNGDFTLTPEDSFASVDNMKFKLCSEKLVSFENNIKKAEIEIPYKLFVCGCDFRNVRGNIYDSRYMRILFNMGALTDELEIPETTVAMSNEVFVPSSAALSLPEGLEDKYTPYSAFENMTLEDNCFFNDTVGGNSLYVQKTWELIHRGSFSMNDLEESDYSILEWINSFGFALAPMITNLVEAGIIEKPTRFSDVGKRLAGPLHRSFKLIFRSQFCDGNVRKNTPIYTVCSPYGSKLLEHITGHRKRNPLTISCDKIPIAELSTERRRTYVRISNQHRIRSIRMTLALNQWFALTARRHKQFISDYSLYSIFDTDNHFEGRANVHAYIQLGNQAFFAQAFRAIGDTKITDELVDKLQRLCILATFYRSLIRYDQQLNTLKKQPIIVLICEDYDHCVLLNSLVENIYPNVRKLFTFDTLLNDQEAFNGAGNYFEFVTGVPHSVKLEDLIDN